MRAINHAITGAVIGLGVANPWLAVPAAVASHFALDALPHYDSWGDNRTGKSFQVVLLADALASIGLVCFLALWQPQNWTVAAVCAFAAAAPDFIRAADWWREMRGRQPRRHGPIWRFHHRIQWYERPPGAVVEIAWFLAMSWLLYQFGR